MEIIIESDEAITVTLPSTLLKEGFTIINRSKKPLIIQPDSRWEFTENELGDIFCQPRKFEKTPIGDPEGKYR